MMQAVLIRAVFLVSTLMTHGVLWQCSLGQDFPAPAPGERESLKETRAGLSIRSCMSSACHGSQQADAPDWQRAGRVWFDSDPHAHAFTTLLSDASQRIVNRLVGPTPVGSTEYQRVLETRCVSCHSSELAPLTDRALGVDCQACHGPANAWGEEHYAQTTLAKGAHRFEGTRRIDMESLPVRAQVCASCHVGHLNRDGGDREVDHRLMAAGHPTTYFDFGNYLERYPAHWDRAAEDTRLGDNAAYQKWRVGKLQTAIARVQLLCDRARRMADWPEFTEYSCTSCHHELASPAWRQIESTSSKTNRPQGRSVWDDWYLEYIDLAGENLAGGDLASEDSAIHPSTIGHDGAEIHNALPHLRQLMQQPFPDTDKVVKTSQELMRQLTSISQSTLGTSVDDARLRLALKDLLASDAFAISWEQGAQWTIATRAIAKSLGLKVPEIAFGNRIPNDFFGTPKVWTLGQPSAFESSDWFQPSALMEYRDSLREQLESKP